MYTVITTETTFQGRKVELTTVVHLRRVEVYTEYADAPGFMRFVGFYDDLCVDTRPRVKALISAIYPTIGAHLAKLY